MLCLKSGPFHRPQKFSCRATFGPQSMRCIPLMYMLSQSVACLNLPTIFLECVFLRPSLVASCKVCTAQCIYQITRSFQSWSLFGNSIKSSIYVFFIFSSAMSDSILFSISLPSSITFSSVFMMFEVLSVTVLTICSSWIQSSFKTKCKHLFYWGLRSMCSLFWVYLI